MQEAEIVEGPLLVAGGDAAELLEAADAALHHVAAAVQVAVELRWAAATPAFGGPLGSLSAALGDDVPHAAPPQRPADARVAVALVAQQQVRPRARRTATPSRHVDAV